MNTKRHLSLFAAMSAVLLGSVPALAANPIAGRWVTEERDAVVEIGDCGRSVCGRIVRFLETPPQGPGQRDINNPDPAKQKRQLMGLPVLSGFVEEPDLWRGEIYDPKTGKSYRSVLRRKNANTLEVKGCISIFCQTQLWKRVK